MEHLALEIFDREGGGSAFADLPDNASITITVTSPIFDSGDVWSYSFSLNIPANAHIFGTSGEMHGGRLHEQIDRRRARLWIEGLPMYVGYIRLGEEAVVDADGDINVTFESGRKTFMDMIEGGKANQVPMMSDIMIGMALDRDRTLDRKVDVVFESRDIIHGPVTDKGAYIARDVTMRGIDKLAQQYVKFVRPDGMWIDKDTGDRVELQKGELINTDYAYDDGHPYCNIKLCYQKSEYRQNGDNLDKIKTRRYQVKEPRSINPAPNFYVLYWLRALMKYLDIHIEENQLMDVEDLRRLFFVNSRCAYNFRDDDGSYSCNENGITYENYVTFGYWNPFFPISEDPEQNPTHVISDDDITVVSGRKPDDLTIHILDLTSDRTTHNIQDTIWRKAYASKECFPNVDIKDVIDALETGFGVRLLFNDDYTRVRVILLRNIFRSGKVHELKCDVLSSTKQENCIRGFRLTFGADEDSTDFNYKGFRLNTPRKSKWKDETDTHDYSQFNFDLEYPDITSFVTPLNKTCYVDPNTGNSFIVKIDKDAKTPDEWNPSLFECAEFMDAEDGDCSGEEETVKEIRVGFVPMISNNIDKEESATQKKDYFALFVDEEMGVSNDNVNIDTKYGDTFRMSKDGYIVNSVGYRSIKQEPQYMNGMFAVATHTPFDLFYGDSQEPFTFQLPLQGGVNVSLKVHGKIRDGYNLYLQDNYDVTDELKIPIEEHDWGLMLGIMRGSGSDATVQAWNDPDDGEGNETWGIVPGGNANAHHDICDNYGNIWKYTGSSDTSEYTGYQFGDKLLSDFGCQNQCDLKNRRGSVQELYNTQLAIKTYTSIPLLILTELGYYATIAEVTDATGMSHTVWLCCVMSGSLQTQDTMTDLIRFLQNGPGQYASAPADATEILRRGASAGNHIIAVDPTTDESILYSVCQYYLRQNQIVHTYSDDRVSFKLRAEKPNPYFDPNQPESSQNRRYLEIEDQDLRQRGLSDQFYKELSYWSRNGRIDSKKLKTGVAELSGIDLCVRQHVGDTVGFVKKMQYTVTKQTGIGDISMEMLYL